MRPYGEVKEGYKVTIYEDKAYKYSKSIFSHHLMNHYFMVFVIYYSDFKIRMNILGFDDTHC